MLRQGRDERFKVTAAEFVLVAVDAAGKPRPVLADGAPGPGGRAAGR